MKMRKTILNALVALLIAGSTGQTAAASEHHGRKVYHPPVVARDAGAFRRAYNHWNGSYDAPANGFGFSGRDPSWVGGEDPSLRPSGS